MVIEARDDVIRLSGSLRNNQWLSIQSAAALLLRTHPYGVVIDCAGLETVSQDGLATFIHAIRHIASSKAPMLMTNLPRHVLTILESDLDRVGPLPVAESVEAARISHATSSQAWWDRLWGVAQQR